jgi:prohibitin 2
MAQQAKQAAQRLGGMFPQGSGKGLGSAAGALIALGGLGYGINTALFNGKKHVNSISFTFSLTRFP